MAVGTQNTRESRGEEQLAYLCGSGRRIRHQRGKAEAVRVSAGADDVLPHAHHLGRTT
jgi:hypothetical protein